MHKDVYPSIHLPESSKLDTEIAFLCLFARVHLDGATLDRLRTLLLQSLNWRHVLGLAHYHKVSSLLYRSLCRLDDSAVPASLLEKLASEHKLRTLRNLLMTHQLVDVVAGLKQVGIVAIPFKGPVLAQAAYGDLALRATADLDLWVHPDLREAAQDWLKTQNFELLQRLPWESLLRNSQNSIDVDLHESLTPDQFPIGLGFNDVESRLQPLSLAGKRIEQMSFEDTLMVQCVGWCKDAWGRSAKLSQLCDIAELVRSHSNLDWAYIEHTSTKLDMQHIVGLPLSLARDWLDAPLPDSVEEHQGLASPHLQKLSQYASRQFWQYGSFIHPDDVPLSTRDHTFYFGLRTSYGARASYIAKQVFVATEKEQAIVDLPIEIPWLYVPIRLLRLLRKYLEYYLSRYF